MSGGVYATMRNAVSAGDVVERTEPLGFVGRARADADAGAVEGMGCGTIPETMQSSWKTAVISTRSGGRFDAEDLRGRVRTRATLIWSAQPMRRVFSSCQ